MILVFFATTGIKSFILRTQTYHNSEVSVGSARMKRSYPSVFFKLMYCWQHNWKAGGCQASDASTSSSIVFFGRMMNLELRVFLFSCMVFTFAWKIFLVCLDFHCVDNIKGSGMGCGKRECAVWLSACFDVSLTAVVSGWSHYMCKVKGHPLSLQFTRKPASHNIMIWNASHLLFHPMSMINLQHVKNPKRKKKCSFKGIKYSRSTVMI